MDANSKPIELCTTMPVIDLSELYQYLSKEAKDGPKDWKEEKPKQVGVSIKELISKMDFGQALELFDGETSVFRGRALDLATSELEAVDKEMKHLKVRAGRIIIYT